MEPVRGIVVDDPIRVGGFEEAGSSKSKARLRRDWVRKGTSEADSASRGRLRISGKGKLTRLMRE